MSFFSNPSVVIQMTEERLTALRKSLRWLATSDDRAFDMLNKINERTTFDGKAYHVPFYSDEAIKFAYLFASFSEAFISLLDGVKKDVGEQQKAVDDTVLTLESVFTAMDNETEFIADRRLRAFSALKREEKSYIKRYIRNGCGGCLIHYGERDYEEDERLGDITDSYLNEVADYLGVDFNTVKAYQQEMLSVYELVSSTGYPDIGRGDKKLSEEDRKSKFERLCVAIPKYSIDFEGFQYGRVLVKKLNCSESLFKRAMQWCRENA